MKRFENKVVAVTGAGQGAGAAIALAFAREGATVYVIGRTGYKLENTVNAGKAEGLENMIPYTLDVGVEEEWKKFAAHIKEAHGEMDVLVNNSGVLKMKNILDMTFEEFKQTESSNLDGVFLGMKYCYDVLKKGVGSAIVNISSMGSLKVGMTTGNDAGYHATKAAINNLTKHTAFVFAPDNIRVNAVLPGGINSQMMKDYYAAHPERIESRALVSPLPPHCSEPEDIAEAVMFLADPTQSRTITGALLSVDNGATLI